MITVSHLSKTYHNPDGSHLTVLKDINCEINAGEVISLIGPSGTGKSTFLRALNLLDPPTGGSIVVDGENILKKGYPVHKLRQKDGAGKRDVCSLQNQKGKRGTGPRGGPDAP